ncbi:arsenate reductase/protein-tyrosine-phosphatase family protein [Microbacterium terrisoli]|jgi:protein-tyrosine phosphatase|uniref:arsenate reductase/protein-tyrosine-phosphatase family protein n=1 Tax=Microbacterium terrisoli TaxID=3242192 RepID=UPI002805819E|nr:hypothetical protein [Microbacterium protaetiae]
MTDRFRIVTVCEGNVHRSPLAETMLRRWAQWYLPGSVSTHVEVSSAGLQAVVGAPMGSRVQSMARALGADGSAHVSQQLTDAMISTADLVLTASTRQRSSVLQRVPAALKRTYTMREAGAAAELIPAHEPVYSVAGLRDLVAHLSHVRRPAGDIIDPHGRDEDAYLQMAREEIPALTALAAALLGMPPADRDAYDRAANDPGALGEPKRESVAPPSGAGRPR